MRMEVGSSVQKLKWGALLVEVEKKKKKRMTVEVNIPANCIIGRYQVAVEISSVCKSGVKVDRKVQPDVFVIFNPFCPGKSM